MLAYHFLKDGQVILIAYHLYKKCFSIRDAKTRRILGYVNRVVVSDVRFIVHQSGRKKVIREAKKNVHAYVRGQFFLELQALSNVGQFKQEAYYNPYTTEAFVDKETKLPIRDVKLALCMDKQVFYSKSSNG